MLKCENYLCELIIKYPQQLEWSQFIAILNLIANFGLIIRLGR